MPLELENQEMVPPGLEPGTLRLLAVRSNQLSYETADIDHFSSLVRISFFDLLVPSDSFTLLNSLARHRETHSLKKKFLRKYRVSFEPASRARPQAIVNNVIPANLMGRLELQRYLKSGVSTTGPLN